MGGKITVNGEQFELTVPSYSYSDTVDLGPEATDGPSIESCGDQTLIEENPTSRLVLETTTFPPNGDFDKTNSVSGYIYHQKRSRSQKNDPWEKVDNFDLRGLKAGEYVRIGLGPDNLRRLFLGLAARYESLGGLDALLAEAGIARADPEAIAIQGREREILERLLAEDPAFWEHLAELDTTEALEAQALREEHKKREAALSEFKQHMEDEDWVEKDWERFFQRNEWIFGLGLTYRYLSEIENQPYLGGKKVSGKGDDNADFLMRTMGQARFAVIVDIKKPNSDLQYKGEYRSDIFRPSEDLGGGAVQLASYCHNWQITGSQDYDQSPEVIDAYTYLPAGLLIIGNTKELKEGTHQEQAAKRKSFELFRRNTINPQIITFDELYARAQYIVEYPGLQEQIINRIDGSDTKATATALPKPPEESPLDGLDSSSGVIKTEGNTTTDEIP